VLERVTFLQFAAGGADLFHPGPEVASLRREGGRGGVEAAVTASSGVAASGAAAIPSARSRHSVSWPAISTSRLSVKCRKNVSFLDECQERRELRSAYGRS
jgi:hypothetical protein